MEGSAPPAQTPGLGDDLPVLRTTDAAREPLAPVPASLMHLSTTWKLTYTPPQKSMGRERAVLCLRGKKPATPARTCHAASPASPLRASPEPRRRRKIPARRVLRPSTPGLGQKEKRKEEPGKPQNHFPGLFNNA